MENERETIDITTVKKSLPWANIGMVFAAVVVTALIVTLYFGYGRLISLHRRLAKQTVRFMHQVEINQNQITALEKSLNDSEQAISEGREALSKQQQMIADLNVAQHGNKDAWSVAEAYYLAKLANDNLQVGDNVSLVIKLLQTADQDLSVLSDAKVLPIRKALAANIAALQNVPVADSTGVYLQLSALNDQVDKLPLPNFRPAAPSDQAGQTDAAHQSWWRKGLQQSWNVMRQIIIVRYNKPGERPFISPDGQQYLYQNCHAMLQQAMSAVVHKQPEIYRKSLQQATSWVQQYFLQDSPITQEMISNMTKLQSVVIRPDFPALTASLQAFQDYMAAQRNA